jgi:hypothetical protein
VNHNVETPEELNGLVYATIGLVAVGHIREDQVASASECLDFSNRFVRRRVRSAGVDYDISTTGCHINRNCCANPVRAARDQRSFPYQFHEILPYACAKKAKCSDRKYRMNRIDCEQVDS